MDAPPPLDTTPCFLEGSYHRVDVALWMAESLAYEPEILKHVRVEFGRVEPVLLMQSVGRRRGGSISIRLRSGRHTACQSGATRVIVDCCRSTSRSSRGMHETGGKQ